MIPFLAILLGLSVLAPQVLFDLPGILERGGDASYGAEQVVNCDTPNGMASALLTIQQDDGALLVGSGADISIAMGAGGFTLLDRDGVVDNASVSGSNAQPESPYEVVDLGDVAYLGREATAYRLERDEILRAELVLDDVTGVVVRAVTYHADGTPYCMHRFISFEPGDRQLPKHDTTDQPALVPLDAGTPSPFPEMISGFTRLDQYEDAEGVQFTYYSDGFFSFAVFETPALVVLPEAGLVEMGPGQYQRVFTPGQVFYAWEAVDGGMAMVGDLPPDMHEAVLAELPAPDRPGLFRRLWRSIFGLSVGRLK